MIKFSRPFWVANFVELLERLAYYAVFIVITLYLSNVWGFSDIEAGVIAGLFSASLYLLPMFAGAYADKIGFRSAIILAFTLLTIGYVGLGILPTMLENAGLVNYEMTTTYTGLRESYLRWSIVAPLILVVIGGAFIKWSSPALLRVKHTRKQGAGIFHLLHDGQHWRFYRKNGSRSPSPEHGRPRSGLPELFFGRDDPTCPYRCLFLL